MLIKKDKANENPTWYSEQAKIVDKDGNVLNKFQVPSSKF